MNTNQTAAPVMHLTNPAFPYVPSANTDVTRTFKRHGWTAPDRRQQVEMKRLLNRIDCDEAIELLDLAAA